MVFIDKVFIDKVIYRYHVNHRDFLKKRVKICVRFIILLSIYIDHKHQQHYNFHAIDKRTLVPFHLTSLDDT